MTFPVRRPQVEGCRYPIGDGLCNSEQTETVDGINGRRCSLHPPADPFAEDLEHDC